MESKTEWKPSTVKTLLSRLVAKNYLFTRKEGKQFVYQASVQEDDAIKEARNELFDKICNKKIGSTLIETVKERELSISDIEILEKLLREKKIQHLLRCHVTVFLVNVIVRKEEKEK